MTRGSAFGDLIQRHESNGLLREYLRRIDPEAVLDHYGVENAHEKGSEIIHSCLLDRVDPHHANGDSNPSASLNTEKKVYNCYTYGGGSIFWFIQKMEGKEHFHEIVPLLGQFLGESTVTDTAKFLDELEQYMTAPSSDAENMPRYHERVLKRWAKYHPYLRDRGITKETAEAFQLGYDEEHVRITIPHWVNGVLVGWQRRALTDPRWPVTVVERAPDGSQLDGGRIPKYKNSTGLPKHSTLYNMDRVLSECGDSSVIVVESPMSVAKAHSCGITNVVATFGAKVTRQQVELLRRFRQVVVWFDDDQAGQYGARVILESLYKHTVVTYVHAEPGKDMADYDCDGMMERLRPPNVEPGVMALMRMDKKK